MALGARILGLACREVFVQVPKRGLFEKSSSALCPALLYFCDYSPMRAQAVSSAALITKNKNRDLLMIPCHAPFAGGKALSPFTLVCNSRL